MGYPCFRTGVPYAPARTALRKAYVGLNLSLGFGTIPGVDPILRPD